MKQFLSCDWGTSSFRLRLVDMGTQEVMGEETSALGTAGAYASWQRAGTERLSYYNGIINDHIQQMERDLGRSLTGVPVVISGMASSTIGMMEVPYKQVPFLTDGSDLEIRVMGPGEIFSRKTIIISGARTEVDVMRGEETKLVGCHAGASQQDRLYILPGTHPKHVTVQENVVTGFSTYMTGEYFDLLSNKSILAVSVEAGGNLGDENNERSFRHGVKDSSRYNLLHGSFLVRTNELFKKYTKQENYFYLSGLVIGSELKDLAVRPSALHLLGDAVMSSIYSLALETLEIPVAAMENADEALIRGQAKIYAGLHS